MEDNRKEVDPSGQEHIEGEQNGQTIQLLVDDQNVKPSADEIKKARKREADKKCRDRKKQKMEANESQLKNERAVNAELKKILDKLEKKYATLKGKQKQSQKNMELIIEACRSLQQTVEQQNTLIKRQAETNEQQNTMIYELTQQLAAAKEQQNAAIQRQNAWKNMPQPPLVPGTTGFETGEIGLPVVHHQPGGPVIPESLPLLRQGGPPYPPLSDGGLTPGADPFDNHGLNYTSPPGVAMVSGSSLMEGLLAPGRQLPIEATGFGPGETGLPVHYQPAHHFGTTMGSGGLAFEDSPGIPQSQLSQGWTHGNNSEQPTLFNADQFPGVN